MTSSKAQKLCSVSKKRSSRPTLSHKKGAGRVQIWVSFGPRIPESMSWTHGNPKIYFLVGCSSFWKNRRLVNVHVHTYNIYRYRERYKSYKYNPFSNDMQFFWHGIIIRATLIIIKVQVINVNRTYTTDPLEKKTCWLIYNDWEKILVSASTVCGKYYGQQPWKSNFSACKQPNRKEFYI